MKHGLHSRFQHSFGKLSMTLKQISAKNDGKYPFNSLLRQRICHLKNSVYEKVMLRNNKIASTLDTQLLNSSGQSKYYVWAMSDLFVCIVYQLWINYFVSHLEINRQITAILEIKLHIYFSIWNEISRATYCRQVLSMHGIRIFSGTLDSSQSLILLCSNYCCTRDSETIVT